MKVNDRAKEVGSHIEKLNPATAFKVLTLSSTFLAISQEIKTRYISGKRKEYENESLIL